MNTVRQQCIADFSPYFGRVIKIRLSHFLKTWRKFTDSQWRPWPVSVQDRNCCLLQSLCFGIIILIFPYLAVLGFAEGEGWFVYLGIFFNCVVWNLAAVAAMLGRKEAALYNLLCIWFVTVVQMLDLFFPSISFSFFAFFLLLCRGKTSCAKGE